MLPPGPG